MSQTTTTAPLAAAEQGTYHYVLTLQRPLGGGGFQVFTASGTLTPASGATRYDLYQLIVDSIIQRQPHLAGANTLLFDLQPNQL